MEGLEHETDRAAPKQCALIVAERGKIDALEQHAPGIGLIEPREQIQEGRLADPGLAHDGDVGAGGEIQAQPLEQRSAGPVALPEILEPEYRAAGQSSHRLRRRRRR